jgi:hypothetical protein
MGIDAFSAAIGESAPLPLGSNNVGRIVEFPVATPVVEFPAGVPIGANVGGLVVGGDGIGAAAAVVGSGIAAIGAGLSAPVSLPVIGGSIAIAAIVGGVIGYFMQPPVGSTGSSYVGKPFAVVSKGTPGKYLVGLQAAGGGYQNGSGVEAYAPISVSYATFPTQSGVVGGLSGSIGDIDGNSIPYQYISGFLAVNISGAWLSLLDPGGAVPFPGTAVPPQREIDIRPRPSDVFNDLMKRGLPGFPGGDTIPTRPPVPTPVRPGNRPNSPPAPGLRAPTTGRTAAPLPDAPGAWTIDPIIPKENVPQNPVPKEKNRERDASGIIITGGNCPSPCPPVDLSAVLQAIADVKLSVLDDLQLDTDVWNFLKPKDPPRIKICDVSQPVDSFPLIIETLARLFGFEKAIKIGFKPDGSDDTFCDVSSALQKIGQPTETILIAPDTPQRKPNTQVLVCWFNLDKKVIKQRVRLQIPDAKDVSTQVIKETLPVRIYGGWRCSFRFPTGEQIAGYFLNPDDGFAYLEKAITVLSNLALTDSVARIKTFDAQNSGSIPSGTEIFPVRAFLSDGSSLINSYILKE